MAIFTMECPECRKHIRMNTGLLGMKITKRCTCGHILNALTQNLASRTCSHCGNRVVFDQSKGFFALCPVCNKPINTQADRDQNVHFHCGQCGLRLTEPKSDTNPICTCPVCGYENDVKQRLSKDWGQFFNVIKYEGDSDTLIWKHPAEDFKLGSQLIVHESQKAVFFRDGQVQDVFGAGRYTLDARQLPLMNLVCKFNHSENPFHSEVYFCNLSHHLAVNWGTQERFTLTEPTQNALISLGARGKLNFCISDVQKLLPKLVGTGGKLSRQALLEDPNSHISEYFKSLLSQVIGTRLANIITREKLDVLLLDQEKLRLSELLQNDLQGYFAEYGLTLTRFLLEGIPLPQKGDLGYDEVQSLIALRQNDLTKAVIDADNDVKLAELDAKKKRDIHIQKNAAEVEAARRDTVAQKGETAVVEAQYEGQKRIVEATAAAQVSHIETQAKTERDLNEVYVETTKMTQQGYNHKDELNAEVEKERARAVGRAASNGVTTAVSDAANLGLTMGVVGGVSNMVKDTLTPPPTPPSTPVPTHWVCTCGQVNGPTAMVCEKCKKDKLSILWNCNCGAVGITSSYCPHCGTKRPSAGWNCTCGQKDISTEYCPNCGANNPEDGWDCSCGRKNLASEYCPSCGSKKPEPWDCACGQKGLTSLHCPKCGAKKPEASDNGAKDPEVWDCNCGQTGLTTPCCHMCGAKKPEPWDCNCGQKGLTSPFCHMCGTMKPETWDCACGQKGLTTPCCHMCGAKKPAQ